MPKADIAVFGSINIDLTNRVSVLPQAGETIHADKFVIGLGGKGANQAVAASRMGLHVALAGWIGDDALGILARQHLQNTKLDLQALHVHPNEMTGIASIAINKRGENTIIVAGGSNMAITAADVTRIIPVIRNARVLMMQLEIPMDAVLRGAEIARQNQAYIVLDPAPVPDHMPDALYHLAHIMTPNETETEKLTGIRPVDCESATKAAAILKARGLENVIIKMGGQGVYLFTPNETAFMPPFQVNVIDSVAAGDSFNAGLATGLARGLSLAQSVRIAAACGALATTKAGASEAAPSLEEAYILMDQQSDCSLQIL